MADQCDGDIVLTLRIKGSQWGITVSACQAETHILLGGRHSFRGPPPTPQLWSTHMIMYTLCFSFSDYVLLSTLSLSFSLSYTHTHTLALPHWVYGPVVALQGQVRGEELPALAELRSQSDRH